MKVMKKDNIKRLVCLLLALLLCAAALISCKEEVKEPVMEYAGEKIPLEMYDFVLSRLKGSLARQGHDVSATSEFWDEIHGDSDLTNEEYYTQAALDTCKNYLAALVIFEEEGMTLSKTALENIEEEIGFYIEYDGKGDEAKLDLILQKYGTTTEGLRKIYEIEAKYNAVIASLYGSSGSQIAGNVKDEHYKNNYHRFKQILVSDFYYEYMTDENGDTVYFDSESGKPIYDKSGFYHYDENENRVVDAYGVAIRYDEDGNILYDKENGRPAPTKDENGKAIEHKYSESEMTERVAKIDGIVAAAANGNYSAFEAEMPAWQVYVGAGEYCPDGYYLSDIEAGAYSVSMELILDELKEMKVGEIRVVKGESGYHIVMKYALDAGKYEDTEYAEWFYEFNSSLTNKLFYDKCGKYFDKIELDDDNIAKAKSIRSLAPNYDY